MEGAARSPSKQASKAGQARTSSKLSSQSQTGSQSLDKLRKAVRGQARRQSKQSLSSQARTSSKLSVQSGQARSASKQSVGSAQERSAEQTDAQQEDAPWWRVANPDGHVNVRQAPSMKEEIVGHKMPGDTFRARRVAAPSPAEEEALAELEPPPAPAAGAVEPSEAAAASGGEGGPSLAWLELQDEPGFMMISPSEDVIFLEELTEPREIREAARRKKLSDKAAEDERLAREGAAAATAARRAAEAEKATLWRHARREEPGCAVIWLHGQGESEYAWQDTLDGLTIEVVAGPCRWLWLRAELLPCVTRGGPLTPQWFDVPEFPIRRLVRGVPDRPRREEDPQQIASAVDRVHVAIEALEAEGFETGRIALAGFGQGAALAAHAALRFPRALAGAALCSAWVPCTESLAEAVAAAGGEAGGGWLGSGLRTPLLWVHGARDGVVEPQLAVEHAKALQALGATVDFRLFPELPFGFNRDVCHAFQGWLSERLVAAALATMPGPGTEVASAASAAAGAAADVAAATAEAARDEEGPAGGEGGALQTGALGGCGGHAFGAPLAVAVAAS